MGSTNKRYEPEFKKKVVQMVLEQGRTIRSINNLILVKELSAAGSDSSMKNAG